MTNEEIKERFEKEFVGKKIRWSGWHDKVEPIVFSEWHFLDEDVGQELYIWFCNKGDIYNVSIDQWDDDIENKWVLAEEPQSTDELVAERGEDYGHPYDDFSKTALMWEAILGIKINPRDVGLCMIAVKMSREINKHKQDNLDDIKGYVKCIEMIEERIANE